MKSFCLEFFIRQSFPHSLCENTQLTDTLARFGQPMGVHIPATRNSLGALPPLVRCATTPPSGPSAAVISVSQRYPLVTARAVERFSACAWPSYTNTFKCSSDGSCPPRTRPVGSAAASTPSPSPPPTRAPRGGPRYVGFPLPCAPRPCGAAAVCGILPPPHPLLLFRHPPSDPASPARTAHPASLFPPSPPTPYFCHATLFPSPRRRVLSSRPSPSLPGPAGRPPRP